MSRKSKEQQLADLHLEALNEFDDIYAAVRDERLQSYEDRRFVTVAGAQWEGPIGEQFDNKARFEFNKTALAVTRVINEYRANRITVDFQPPDGSDDDEFADVCDGLYRADEQACSANEAYDNAFEEAVQGGMGAWRIRAEYEDEDDEENERQNICIEPIYDADISVFFELGAKRQDKSDATRCYVLSPMPRAKYEAEYDDSPSDWPRLDVARDFDWSTGDLVWIAEYYRVEKIKETIHWFEGFDEESAIKVSQRELDEDPAMLGELAATGWTLVKTRKVARNVVRKYIMSGGGILEDCGVVPGRHIPVVVVYGKRNVVNGVERFMGHVRLAKDAQRLLNSLLSWLGEMAARFDVEKPILTPEQIAGHTAMWSQDSVKRYPYLLINPTTDENGQRQPVGPVAYTRAPQIPPAMAALTQIAEQGLNDLLGNQQAGEDVQEQMSGKAIELIQNRLDMQSFIYMSNFAKGMKRSGEIWLPMKKDIAVEEKRKTKTIGPEGEAGMVILNEPAYNKKTGEIYIRNDIANAKYDVVVDVGPSSSSKRAATVRSLTGMMQVTQDPEAMQLLSSLALMNMEGEGLSDVRQFARNKLVRSRVIKPTAQEQEEMSAEAQGQAPDPQAQYLMAAADEAATQAQKNRAQVVETISNAELKRAKTAETYANVSDSVTRQQLASAESLRGLLAVQRPELPIATPKGLLG